jgi:hypothetical protein
VQRLLPLDVIQHMLPHVGDHDLRPWRLEQLALGALTQKDLQAVIVAMLWGPGHGHTLLTPGRAGLRHALDCIIRVIDTKA